MPSAKASILAASEALAASVRESLPFSLLLAPLTRLAWKRIPYLGVSCLVFMALNKAFSAPSSCTVDDGYLASVIRLPAAAISLAPTMSPTTVVRLGDSIRMRCDS